MKRKNITDENLTDNTVFYAAILTLSPNWYSDDASGKSNTFYWRMVGLFRQSIGGTSRYKSIYEAVCHWGLEALHE